MRLFFDCRYTRTRVHDGISRFTAGLVGAAAEQTEVTMLISEEAQLNLLPELPHLRISSPTSVREPWVARQISPHRPDVVFSPMQTMGGRGRNYPLVLTVHDLIYYDHRTPPRNLPAHVRLGWRAYHLSSWPQRIVLNGADAVAVVSDTTRGELGRRRMTRRPIGVVPNAPDAAASPRDPLRTPERELVYMGSFMGYKNVETLVRGINRLPEHRLHLCSPVEPSVRARLTALAERPGQLLFHDGIAEEDYHTLLGRASAAVTLSRAEGYGLPVIEAMSHGTPVVASDVPIFAEITGKARQDDGAQLVDPDDPAAFADAVRRLQDPALFARASRAARARSLDYTWAESAAHLLQLSEKAQRQRTAGAR